jgi:two-component system sensor histidine kinase AlgZ
MDELLHTEVRAEPRGVYPPTFCSLRMAVAVIAVTQLCVLLIGLGRLEGFTWRWLFVTTPYAQSLALLCALGVCISRAWLQRLQPRGAWIGSWVIAVLLALAFSYAAAVIGTVLGVGPGRNRLTGFMLQSVLAVALVTLALLRYLFIRAQWQLELTAQADARVQALHARIRPHFLFNCLNTIASLIPEEPQSAERATEDLADLFRGGMQRADRLIPLAEELELARKYLDMERRRLGDRLEISWETGELPADARVMPLILQPLLENAVTHGIQALPGGGAIRIYGRREGENVVIAVSNPVPAGPVPGPDAAPGHGMALQNIRARLRLACGDRASLVTQRDGDRFFAVLTLPHVENPDHR